MNKFTSDRMLERFHDTEERVRLQAVVSVCEAAAERIYAVSDEVAHYFCHRIILFILILNVAAKKITEFVSSY